MRLAVSKQPVSQLFFSNSCCPVCYLFKQSDFALNIATGLVSVPERRLVSDQRDFVVLWSLLLRGLSRHDRSLGGKAVAGSQTDGPITFTYYVACSRSPRSLSHSLTCSEICGTTFQSIYCWKYFNSLVCFVTGFSINAFSRFLPHHFQLNSRIYIKPPI